jgi:hypothetical protein
MVKFYEGGADKKKQQFDAAQAELDKVSVNFMPLFIKIYEGILVVYRIIRLLLTLIFFGTTVVHFPDTFLVDPIHFFNHSTVFLSIFRHHFNRFSNHFLSIFRPFQSIFRHPFNRFPDTIFYLFSDTIFYLFSDNIFLKIPTPLLSILRPLSSNF